MYARIDRRSTYIQTGSFNEVNLTEKGRGIDRSQGGEDNWLLQGWGESLHPIDGIRNMWGFQGSPAHCMHVCRIIARSVIF